MPALNVFRTGRQSDHCAHLWIVAATRTYSAQNAAAVTSRSDANGARELVFTNGVCFSLTMTS
jgi:hypothetical protein